MSNEFLNDQEYANTMLLLVKNQLVAGRNVDGQYKDQMTDKNGLSINVKRPPRFIANDGPNLQAQDVITGSENVAVDQYKNVHISIGDLEAVQSFNELMRNKSMMSAASELAHNVDAYLHDRFLDFFSWVGDAGTTLGSTSAFNSGHTRLMEQSVPNSDLAAILTFADGQGIRDQLTGTDISGVNRTSLERTRIPLISEVDAYASQNTQALVTGTRTNGTVDGANQNVNYRDVKDNARMSQTINIAGVGAGATIARGEVFTIGGVEAINPRTRLPLGRDQQFTVLEAATADGTGAVQLTISPAIIVYGTNDGTSTTANSAFATARTAPANGATVTWKGSSETTYQVRAMFNRQAIALVSARLETPATGSYSFAVDEETGIAIRYWRGSDISTGSHVHRWDMIYGAEMMDNNLGTRIDGVLP